MAFVNVNCALKKKRCKRKAANVMANYVLFVRYQLKVLLNEKQGSKIS